MFMPMPLHIIDMWQRFIGPTMTGISPAYVDVGLNGIADDLEAIAIYETQLWSAKWHDGAFAASPIRRDDVEPVWYFLRCR